MRGDRDALLWLTVRSGVSLRRPPTLQRSCCKLCLPMHGRSVGGGCRRSCCCRCCRCGCCWRSSSTVVAVGGGRVGGTLVFVEIDGAIGRGWCCSCSLWLVLPSSLLCPSSLMSNLAIAHQSWFQSKSSIPELAHNFEPPGSDIAPLTR